MFERISVSGFVKDFVFGFELEGFRLESFSRFILLREEGSVLAFRNYSMAVIFAFFIVRASLLRSMMNPCALNPKPKPNHVMLPHPHPEDHRSAGSAT